MKKFVMNISIHVQAETPQEAFEVLMNEKSLQAIAKAIEVNKDNIKEVYEDDKLVNQDNFLAYILTLCQYISCQFTTAYTQPQFSVDFAQVSKLVYELDSKSSGA